MENLYESKNSKSLAKDRIIKNDNEILNYNPDIIFVSWCGKKFKKEKNVKQKKIGIQLKQLEIMKFMK